MLKRMSRRFIGAAMAAITAVVLVLLCCLNLWNYRGVAGQLDSTLGLLAAADGRWPDFALQQPAPPRGGAGCWRAKSGQRPSAAASRPSVLSSWPATPR